MKTKPRNRARERFVHLGDRLAVLGRIEAGAWTIDQAARALDVDAAQVRAWQRRHANERIVRVAEMRPRNDAKLRRLHERARRLSELLARSERALRSLHQDLLKSAGEGVRPPRPASNKSG